MRYLLPCHCTQLEAQEQSSMNILSVLDAVIDGECMDTDVLLMQARAAVAELMDAAAAIVEHDTDSPAHNRVLSALARVGGGK